MGTIASRAYGSSVFLFLTYTPSRSVSGPASPAIPRQDWSLTPFSKEHRVITPRGVHGKEKCFFGLFSQKLTCNGLP